MKLFRVLSAVAVALLILLTASFSLASAEESRAMGGPLTEAFDDILTLPAAGWVQDNNSNPPGSTTWFQGNPAVFTAHAGATNAYIGANFNNAAGTGNISNWLLTPELTLEDGAEVVFWTRVPTASAFPDRLQVRLSTAGASVDVGTTDADVGVFTTLLQDINPGLVAGGYPEVWTPFTITLSGLGAPTQGRVGFRYFVTNGGPTGANSNYIGIDTFSYTPPTAGPATITLDKTVGTDPATCGATDVITVTVGSTAYYCYTVTNTGSVTLTTHDLSDDMLGTILSGYAYDLGPGASVSTVDAGLVISSTILTTTVNTATWDASNATGGSAVATDTATVNVSIVTAVTLGLLEASQGTGSSLPLAALLLAGLAAGTLIVLKRRYSR